MKNFVLIGKVAAMTLISLAACKPSEASNASGGADVESVASEASLSETTTAAVPAMPACLALYDSTSTAALAKVKQIIVAIDAIPAGSSSKATLAPSRAKLPELYGPLAIIQGVVAVQKGYGLDPKQDGCYELAKTADQLYLLYTSVVASLNSTMSRGPIAERDQTNRELAAAKAKINTVPVAQRPAIQAEINRLSAKAIALNNLVTIFRANAGQLSAALGQISTTAKQYVAGKQPPAIRLLPISSL